MLEEAGGQSKKNVVQAACLYPARWRGGSFESFRTGGSPRDLREREGGGVGVAIKKMRRFSHAYLSKFSKQTSWNCCQRLCMRGEKGWMAIQFPSKEDGEHWRNRAALRRFNKLEGGQPPSVGCLVGGSGGAL